MSSYYDSDDDVAWGPVTLREIKRTFKNPALKKVSRRHTLQVETEPTSQSQVKRTLKTMEAPVMNTVSLSKDVINNYNITSSSSEYFTPNTTMAEKKSLNGTHSSLAKNIDTQFDLKNIEKTLVECTTLNEWLEYDNIDNTQGTDELDDSCIIMSINSSTQSKNFKEDFDNEDFNVESPKKYSCEQKVDISNATQNILGEENDDQSFLSEENNDVQSNFSEKDRSTDSIVENQFEMLIDRNTTVGGEKPLSCEEFSPIQVPKIDLAGFDESDDCLELNDTLERIERLLNADSDYSGEEQDVSSEPSPSKSECFQSPLKIISGSFSQSPSHSNLPKAMPPTKTLSNLRIPTPRKLKSPTKVFYDFNVEKNTPSTARKDEVKNKVTTPTGQFKMPRTPVRPKHLLNNKNIISPVGMYIKYSPKSPLTTCVKQPIEQKKGIAISHIPQSQRLAKTNIENHGVIPSVVYQPAKNKLYTVKEQLNLPASIDKMVKKSNVVKHEKRMQFGVHDKDFIKRKLSMESELTKYSISDSLLDENSQDISVLTSKNAFK